MTTRNTPTVLLSLVLSLVMFTISAQAQDRQPNIILIFCDDLGFGDIGVFWQNERAATGQPAHATPHIDAMAEQGVQMLGAYCPAPVCAPSRASLLLGVTQGHANIRNNQFDKALEDNHTLASIMGEAGYATAAFGKWGLQGNAQPNIENTFPGHPMNRGFDYFLGYMRHRDGHRHYPHEDGKELYDGDTDIADQLALCYTTDLFTARSKKWIVDHVAENPEEPFFVFLSYDTPHAILQNPPCAYPEGGGLEGGVQWLGESGHMLNTSQGDYDGWVHPDYAEQDWPEQYIRYANGVRRIDDSVGDVLQLLQDLDIDDNTLVIFTTDNGPSKESYLQGRGYSPEFFQSFGPFDGIKRDLWEGGIRTGAIARWPQTIPAGTTTDEPLTFADFLATFADAAGAPTPARCDGVSMLPTMTGQGDQKPANIYIEYQVGGRTPNYQSFEPGHAGRQRGQMQVIRLGDFVGVRYNIQSHEDAFEIYNIIDDPKQANNLAGDREFDALQQQMHDEVLRRRRPNASAARPYDNIPIPAIDEIDTAPGLVLRTFARSVSYVPMVDFNEAVAHTNISYIEAIATQENATLLFTGYLNATETGEYTLRLESSGKAILRLHHATVIDADRPFVLGESFTATVYLEQGRHPIRLYANTSADTDDSDLNLSWSSPGFEMQRIDDSAFSRDAE